MMFKTFCLFAKILTFEVDAHPEDELHFFL